MIERWSRVVALMVLASSPPLSADPSDRDPAPMVRFALDGAGELGTCISEPALRAAVVSRLGRDPFRSDAADLLRVTLTATAAEPAGLHARIEREGTGGTRGARELDAPATDCPGLLDTLALSIAIAADPIGFARGPAPAAPPPPVPVPEDKTPHVSGSASVGVIGTLGQEPSPSAGFALQLAVRRGALSVAAELRLDLPAAQTVDRGRIEVSAALGALVGCLALPAPHLCVVAGGGRLRGRGEGFAITRTDQTWTAVVGARLAWPVRLGAVTVVPSFDLLASPIRTTFDVDGARAWETPLVQASLGVAAGVTFF